MLSPSSRCLGAATALSHPGQERFQGTLGCGMEALGGGEKAGRLPVLVGPPGCHRVRAGKGPPQAPDIAAEITRVPEQPELHLSLKAQP